MQQFDKTYWPRQEADLTTWDPGREFDLVTTHYAHAEIPQLKLFV